MSSSDWPPPNWDQRLFEQRMERDKKEREEMERKEREERARRRREAETPYMMMQPQRTSFSPPKMTFTSQERNHPSLNFMPQEPPLFQMSEQPPTYNLGGDSTSSSSFALPLNIAQPERKRKQEMPPSAAVIPSAPRISDTTSWEFPTPMAPKAARRDDAMRPPPLVLSRPEMECPPPPSIPSMSLGEGIPLLLGGGGGAPKPETSSRSLEMPLILNRSSQKPQAPEMIPLRIGRPEPSRQQREPSVSNIENDFKDFEAEFDYFKKKKGDSSSTEDKDGRRPRETNVTRETVRKDDHPQFDDYRRSEVKQEMRHLEEYQRQSEERKESRTFSERERHSRSHSGERTERQFKEYETKDSRSFEERDRHSRSISGDRSNRKFQEYDDYRPRDDERHSRSHSGERSGRRFQEIGERGSSERVLDSRQFQENRDSSYEKTRESSHEKSKDSSLLERLTKERLERDRERERSSSSGTKNSREERPDSRGRTSERRSYERPDDFDDVSDAEFDRSSSAKKRSKEKHRGDEFDDVSDTELADRSFSSSKNLPEQASFGRQRGEDFDSISEDEAPPSKDLSKRLSALVKQAASDSGQKRKEEEKEDRGRWFEEETRDVDMRKGDSKPVAKKIRQEPSIELSLPNPVECKPDESVNDVFDTAHGHAETELPEGWMRIKHKSGMPVYVHLDSRVVTVTRPYMMDRGTSMSNHSIPITSIPCLASTITPDQVPKLEGEESTRLKPEEARAYCNRRFHPGAAKKVTKVKKKSQKKLTKGKSSTDDIPYRVPGTDREVNLRKSMPAREALRALFPDVECQVVNDTVLLVNSRCLKIVHYYEEENGQLAGTGVNWVLNSAKNEAAVKAIRKMGPKGFPFELLKKEDSFEAEDEIAEILDNVTETLATKISKRRQDVLEEIQTDLEEKLRISKLLRAATKSTTEKPKKAEKINAIKDIQKSVEQNLNKLLSKTPEKQIKSEEKMNEDKDEKEQDVPAVILPVTRNDATGAHITEEEAALVIKAFMKANQKKRLVSGKLRCEDGLSLLSCEDLVSAQRAAEIVSRVPDPKDLLIDEPFRVWLPGTGPVFTRFVVNLSGDLSELGFASFAESLHAQANCQRTVEQSCVLLASKRIAKDGSYATQFTFGVDEFLDEFLICSGFKLHVDGKVVFALHCPWSDAVLEKLSQPLPKANFLVFDQEKKSKIQLTCLVIVRKGVAPSMNISEKEFEWIKTSVQSSIKHSTTKEEFASVYFGQFKAFPGLHYVTCVNKPRIVLRLCHAVLQTGDNKKFSNVDHPYRAYRIGDGLFGAQYTFKLDNVQEHHQSGETLALEIKNSYNLPGQVFVTPMFSAEQGSHFFLSMEMRAAKQLTIDAKETITVASQTTKIAKASFLELEKTGGKKKAESNAIKVKSFMGSDYKSSIFLVVKQGKPFQPLSREDHSKIRDALVTGKHLPFFNKSCLLRTTTSETFVKLTDKSHVEPVVKEIASLRIPGVTVWPMWKGPLHCGFDIELAAAEGKYSNKVLISLLLKENKAEGCLSVIDRWKEEKEGRITEKVRIAASAQFYNTAFSSNNSAIRLPKVLHVIQKQKPIPREETVAQQDEILSDELDLCQMRGEELSLTLLVTKDDSNYCSLSADEHQDLKECFRMDSSVQHLRKKVVLVRTSLFDTFIQVSGLDYAKDFNAFLAKKRLRAWQQGQGPVYKCYTMALRPQKTKKHENTLICDIMRSNNIVGFINVIQTNFETLGPDRAIPYAKVIVDRRQDEAMNQNGLVLLAVGRDGVNLKPINLSLRPDFQPEAVKDPSPEVFSLLVTRSDVRFTQLTETEHEEIEDEVLSHTEGMSDDWCNKTVFVRSANGMSFIQVSGQENVRTAKAVISKIGEKHPGRTCKTARPYQAFTPGEGPLFKCYSLSLFERFSKISVRDLNEEIVKRNLVPNGLWLFKTDEEPSAGLFKCGVLVDSLQNDIVHRTNGKLYINGATVRLLQTQVDMSMIMSKASK